MRAGRFSGAVGGALVAALVVTAAVVPAGSAQAASKTLRIGVLLPKTGSLQILGPPAIAGAKLALKDINAAGGVFGRDVQIEIADSGDDRTDTASRSLDKLLNNGADVIVGPASSAVALSVIDKAVAKGVPMIGTSTSSIKLSQYPDKGLYFRMPPSDAYQGTVVGKLAISDGKKKLAILARQDAYGTVLADRAAKAFKAGGGKVVKKIIYSPSENSFSSYLSTIKAAKPDAIAVIGFEETSLILSQMRSKNLLPQSTSNVRTYLVDGNMMSGYPLPKGTLTGVRGVIPGAVASSDFKKRISTIDPKLKDFSFAAEAYDATILAALAAEAAKSDKGTSIAAKLAGASKDGTKCTTFKACVALARKGKSFDYDGQSGRISFDSLGDIRWAKMPVYEFNSDNKYRYKKTVSGSVPAA